MEDFVQVYLVFALMVVVVGLLLYLMLRLLHWAGTKPLPRTESPLLKTFIVGLVAMIAVALLLGIELEMVLRGIRENLMWLVETVNVIALSVIGVAVVIVFMIVRRRQKDL